MAALRLFSATGFKTRKDFSAFYKKNVIINNKIYLSQYVIDVFFKMSQQCWQLVKCICRNRLNRRILYFYTCNCFLFLRTTYTGIPVQTGQPVSHGVAKSLLIRYAKLCRQVGSVSNNAIWRKFQLPGQIDFCKCACSCAHLHHVDTITAHVHCTFAQIQSLSGSGHDRLSLFNR